MTKTRGGAPSKLSLAKLIPALAILATFGVIVVIWWMATGADLSSSLRALGVRPIEPHFIDLHNVTAAAACAERGYDPLEFNPCDQMNRPMNYPRIWLHFGRLVNRLGQVQLAGVSIGLAYVCSVLGTLARYGRVTSLLVGILLISPASILGVERANIDLVLITFLLLMYATAFLGRRNRWNLFMLSVGVASLLKYWPLFGSLGFLRHPNKRQAVAGFVIIGAVLAGYTLLTWPDLLTIASAVPTGCWPAYGWSVPFICFDEVVEVGASPVGWPRFGLAVAGLSALSAIGVFSTRRLDSSLTVNDDLAGAAFYLGAGGFLGTFLLGANWDYRLVVLICCVPQLVQWSDSHHGPVRHTVRVAIGLIVMRMWSSMSSGTAGSVLLVKTIALISSLLLFALLAGLVARSVRGELSRAVENPRQG